MPCFEHLFPDEYDSVVQDALWHLAWFHALARLRAHSERTLLTFDEAVITLGQAMRAFLTRVCAHVKTKELPKETRARQRRKQAASKETVKVSPNTKTLNLNTYKYHRLGDYVQAIRRFGPTDNYDSRRVRSRLLIIVNYNLMPC